MNVNEICRRGFFDKVTLNVMTEPIYGDDVEVFEDRTFDECISNVYNSIDTTVFKVRISVLGVDCIKKQAIKPSEIGKINARGAALYKENKRADKSYLLAYMDLIVIKDTERNKFIVERRFQGETDKSVLLDVALSLQSEGKNSSKINNILIVDRVYVYEMYRRCGISTWLHKNVRDVIESYTGVNIGDMLLIPGDFANEAGDKFYMDNKQYITMLSRHYQLVGYKNYGNGLMINRVSKSGLREGLTKLTITLKDKMRRDKDSY